LVSASGKSTVTPVELAGAQEVEQVPAQLAGGFADAAQPRCRVDGEVVAGRQRVAGNQRGGDARLDELLLGVVQEPGVGDAGVIAQRFLRLSERPLGVRRELGCGGVVVAVHGPDARARRPDHLPAGRQRDLSSAVGVAEGGADGVDVRRELAAPGRAQLPERRRSSAGSGRVPRGR
jgi:hypothetical protein